MKMQVLIGLRYANASFFGFFEIKGWKYILRVCMQNAFGIFIFLDYENATKSLCMQVWHGLIIIFWHARLKCKACLWKDWLMETNVKFEILVDMDEVGFWMVVLGLWRFLMFGKCYWIWYEGVLDLDMLIQNAIILGFLE